MESKLKGKKLFSIGKLPMDQGNLRGLIRQQGGDFAFSLSKNLDFIIEGDKATPDARKKAVSTGVPLISYEEFCSMLNKDLLTFSLDNINGTEPPEQLFKLLSEKNWELWLNDSDLDQIDIDKLFNLLKIQEVNYGVTKVHTFCSDQLISQFRLKFTHPFHHFDEIKNHDISPNGKFLATCCQRGTKPEEPVILQIWDLTSCKVVNQIELAAYVGVYKFETALNGIRWSPDSSMLAVAHNLNGIAIFDAHQGRKMSEISITDGIPSAVSYYWTSDSKRVMICWPYYQKLKVPNGTEVEKNITWLPAEIGTRDPSKINSLSMKLAEPGKESDYAIIKKHSYHAQVPPPIKDKLLTKNGVVYYTSEDRIIAITLHSIHFFDENGKLIIEHYFGKPHELFNFTEIVSRLIKRYNISPVFPLNDGLKGFGVVSFMADSNNMIYAPNSYDYKKIINISFCGKHSWPFDWVSEISQKDITAVESDPEFKRFA